MSRLVGLRTADGVVPVVDLGSLRGVPSDIVTRGGPPVPPEWLDALPDGKVTYADDAD